MAIRNPARQFSQRAFCAAAVAVLLGSRALRGADVEINRQLLPEAPAKPLVPPKVQPKDTKESVFKDLITPGAMTVPVPFSTPTVILRRPLTRAEEEKVDQQKNWIFVTPKTADQSPEALLGVRKEKLEGEEVPFKSVLERYLDTATASDQPDKSRTNNSGRARDNEARDKRDPLGRGERKTLFGLDFERDGKETRRDGTRESNTTKTSTVGQIGLPAALLRMPGDYSNGSSAIADLNYSSPYNNGTDLRERRERDEDRKVRAAEFRAILEGRNLAAKVATGPNGTKDPINLLQDGTAQAVNPVTGNSLEAFTKGGGASASAIGNPAGGLGRASALGDSAARPLGNSALSPAGITAPPVSSIIQQPKPAVLEIPRRKL